jgi:hypothetical protein
MTGFKLSLLLGLAATAIGCGGDDDAGPPQIQPHLNPVAFGNFEAGAAPQEFQVILTNVGGGTLTISSLEVNGDVNCALDPAPVFSDPTPISLVEGEGTFLAIYYVPGGTGNNTPGTKDQISVAVESNSNEFPLMEVSICGCILDHPPEEGDPECECNLNEVQDADCGG